MMMTLITTAIVAAISVCIFIRFETAVIVAVAVVIVAIATATVATII